ncbi:MAG: tetratricopeptide repeat protein [Ideonella sp.]|nr:tetratricopeptide repeat protein [Ideonella sp.]
MTQTVDVQGGDHNTVVQIDGNGNTVVLGQPHLRLTRFEAERNKPLTDTRLLIPARRAIPLFGRDEELKSLLDFVRPDAPPDIRVRVLVGSGGSGKTRLALELCDQIKDRWLAGFVTTDALDRFFKQQDAGCWGWQKPTLMVLDYAAAQAEVLQRWLPELQERGAQPQHPLRVLLLERHADPDSGWHQRVFNPGGWKSAGTRDLLDPPEPVPIRPLYEVENRLGVIRSVLTLVKPDLLPLLTPKLLDDSFQQTPWGGDPLYLAMAALTMAQRSNASALRLGRTDLALEVAGHEMNRLAQAAQSRGLASELVQHLAACITLLQGLPRIEALGLIRSEKQAIGFEQGDPAKLVDVLHECFTDGERIAGVQPDLIGEALLLKVWNKPERAEAIARLFADHAPRVTETLVRVVQDYSQTDPKAKLWFEKLLMDQWSNQQVLERIHAALPDMTVALSDVRLRLAQRLQALETNLDPEVQAKHLALLTVAYTDLGKFDDALKAGQQATDMYRCLARNTSSCIPDLAMSLNNLVVALSANDLLDAALKAALESVELYRALVRQHPDVFEPNLACALSTTANTCVELGQFRSALEVAEISADMYRDLVKQRLETYKPDLALTLNNLANIYSSLERFDDALEVAQQAADMYRQLAGLQPDAHLPKWAMSLTNLVGKLAQLGHLDRALEVALQATALYLNGSSSFSVESDKSSLRPG